MFSKETPKLPEIVFPLEKDDKDKNKAVKIFETVQKKLKLEEQIQPSDELIKRLELVKNRINFFSDPDLYG